MAEGGVDALDAGCRAREGLDHDDGTREGTELHSRRLLLDQSPPCDARHLVLAAKEVPDELVAEVALVSHELCEALAHSATILRIDELLNHFLCRVCDVNVEVFWLFLVTIACVRLQEERSFVQIRRTALEDVSTLVVEDVLDFGSALLSLGSG